CSRITPELLTLLELTQPEIDADVACVPGGAAQVQDIYPLAPLQHGLLFHHLASAQGDVYLTPNLLAFDTHAQLQRFLAALQQVISRHDILRTGFVWQGLREPVQLVWREAALPVHPHSFSGPNVAQQLQQQLDPRHHRIDVSQAPLLHAHVADDAQHGRWLLCLLSHHLVCDHTTLELLVEEIEALLGGRAHLLPAPLPFRDFVAQARLGVSQAEHEAFFRAMLGDVQEPSAPFGLLDVQGDGSTITEADVALPAELSRDLRAQARRLGVSAAALFHLAFALMLARTSARSDVVFGTVLFGRLHGSAGAQRTLGMFLNTLPLRLRLDSLGVHAAVRHTQQQLAQLLHHEHATLALAQRCSGVAA
ncbi:MAG: non-ribosomal peptide synthetase, partial [Burkholderiales bacterium]|nr:non-ribosomal peptide synthetase [Burkholderiales bacterium]